MHRRTALATLTLGLCGLACGGMGQATDELMEPWGSMNLPVQQGRILATTEQSLAVVHASGTPREQAARYAAHFEAQGWAELVGDLADDDSPGMIYERGEHALGLQAGWAYGEVLVTLSLAEKP